MDPISTLHQWHNGVRIWHIAHSRASVKYSRQGKLLGIPSIILSTIVGTSLFTSISETSTNTTIIFIAGLLSLSSAVLGSLQTFLGYSELSDRHTKAAIGYGELRREIETYLSLGNLPDPQAVLDTVRNKWKTLEESAPNPPQAIYDEASKAITKYSKD